MLPGGGGTGAELGRNWGGKRLELAATVLSLGTLRNTTPNPLASPALPRWLIDLKCKRAELSTRHIQYLLHVIPVFHDQETFDCVSSADVYTLRALNNGTTNTLPTD